MIVLDASGSMLELIDGAPRMAVARDALARELDRLPDSSEAGLIAFGHRAKNGCGDVQQLVPIAPLDRSALAAAVAKLAPTGKTPLTAATRRAIDLARARGGSTTVVLVGSRLDSCGASLCDMVERAKAAGVSFVLHVVGFDLANADAEPLRCAAEAGGGRYFAAGSAAELSAALEQSVAALRVPTGLLTVSASAEGKPIAARAEVRVAGGKKFFGLRQLNRGDQHAPATFRLPGGAYELRVKAERRGLPPYQAAFELVAGRQAEQLATFGTGALKLTVTHQGAALQRPPSLCLRRAGERRLLCVGAALLRKSESKPEQGVFALTLASGTYDIEVGLEERAPSARRTLRVVIEAGKTTAQNYNFE